MDKDDKDEEEITQDEIEEENDLAQREFGDNSLTTFAFRGTSPAICGEPLHLVMRAAASRLELAAFADNGRQIMAATATR